jgi:hypothetical protein
MRTTSAVSIATVANHAEHIYARINASTRTAPGVVSRQRGLLPEEGSPRLLAYGVEPSCIACMFFSMTASAVHSASLGLNHTNSVPGSCCTGT